MLTGYSLPSIAVKQKRPKTSSSSSALNRLLAAAVVSVNFRQLLLTEPDRALVEGFQGEFFPLNHQERTLLLNAQANSLKEFALKISTFQENRVQRQAEVWVPAPRSALVLEPG